MLLRPRLVVALVFLAACASPGGGGPPPGFDAMPGRDSGRDGSGTAPGNPNPDSNGGAPPAADATTSPAPADTAAPDQSAPAPAPSPGALETVRVPASGQPASFKTPLAAGEIYLLKASGVVSLSPTQQADAEYAFGVAGVPVSSDELAATDVGVDTGLLQIQRHVHYTPTPPGPGRMKWTQFRGDSTYYMLVTGEGTALTLRFRAPPASATTATGEITVALYPLSPAPPKLGPTLDKELETVAIPITKTIVASTMATTEGKVYLLQASGAGKVGGGGLHLGDAEYMDWDAEGNKRNEGEAGADFGVGVDETGYVKMSGAAYTPRMRWWGPWRKDHTYYLLFTGTGKPIQFLYYDSGYGDNSATDQLAVRIFAAP